MVNSPSRPAVLIRLADAADRATAQTALAGKKYAVAVEDPAAVAFSLPEDAGPESRVVVLDYVAEDAASVKLLQTTTDRPNAPRFVFILPAGAKLDRAQLLMVMNEGAWAVLPAPIEGPALANYVERALNGPGRFRHDRAEAISGDEESARRKVLEEQVRRYRARVTGRDRLIAKILSTPSSSLARRALLVSDSVFQREQLERLLREHGYQVHSAKTVEEGLDMALAEKPRIIVSDLEMTPYDGVELCRKLKIEHKLVPCHFVICTANRDKMAAVMTPGNGVDDCLPKPSGPVDNLEFVSRVSMGLLL